MRTFGFLLILSLAACSVTRNTDRHSGAGISNTGFPIEETGTAPAGDGDYRGKLMEEIAAS